MSFPNSASNLNSASNSTSNSTSNSASNSASNSTSSATSIKKPTTMQRINPELDPRVLVNPKRINSLLKMQEMLFIYNAVLDGWTVRQLDDNRFEFQKARQKVTSDVCLDSYLREFVEYYLQSHAE